MLYLCLVIRAVSDTRVWALERKVFQHIMVTTGIKRMEHQVYTSTDYGAAVYKTEQNNF